MSWIDQSIGTAFYGALGSYQNPFNAGSIYNMQNQTDADGYAGAQQIGARYSQGIAQLKGMQDINASTETIYPVKNGNSMNKKLEAAKKYLADRNKN